MADNLTAYERLLEKKRAQMTEVIENLSKNGIKQNTKEWVEIKKRFIGGSEIASALGKNPYQNIKAFINKKLGLSTPFNETLAMRWGKLFEPMARRFAEHMLNTKIIGDDLFFYEEAKSCAYSPDGLGIVTFEKKVDVQRKYDPDIDQLIAEELENDIDNAAYKRKSLEDGSIIKRFLTIRLPQIILFEFKCPMVRALGPKVPDYYVPQPKAGLNMIKCAEHGIFIELVFRPCKLEDMDFSPNYCKDLEVPDNQVITCNEPDFKTAIIGSKDPKVIRPAATGLIVWMGPKISHNLQKIQKLSLDLNEIIDFDDIIDLSEVSPKFFGLFLEEWRATGMGMIEEGLPTAQGPDPIFAWYSGAFMEKNGPAPSPNNIWARAEAHAAQNDYKIVAYLTWKIIDHRIHDIEKEPDYLDRHAGQIAEVTEFIKKAEARIKNVESENEKSIKGELSKAEIQKQILDRFLKKEESVETMIEKFTAAYSKKYGQAQSYWASKN